MRIAEILMQYKNVEVKEIKPTSVLAIINGIETLISGEICVCHGGRLSISVGDIGYDRIEYPRYTDDRPNGDAEMTYAIEHDMINAIENIFNYKYILKINNQYSINELYKTSYHSGIGSALSYVGMNDEPIADIYDFEVGMVHQHPNDKLYEVVTKVERVEDGIYIEVTSMDKTSENGLRYDKPLQAYITPVLKGEVKLQKKFKLYESETTK